MNGWENHRVEATLHFLERRGRQGGRSIPLRRSRHRRQGKTRRDSALVPRVEAATVDSSSSTPFREWLHVRRARKGLEIFLWNLEGNSSYPEENSFHIPYFFHRFFPLHSAVLNRYVPFIRCLRASLSFLPFFFSFLRPPLPFRISSAGFLAPFRPDSLDSERVV